MADHSPRYILCCVDRTPLAQAVAYAAAGFALQLNAGLTLLRSDERAAGPALPHLTAQGELEQLASAAVLTPAGRRISPTLVLTADAPTEAIDRLTTASPPLMVALGSRKRSAFRRSLFGSHGLTLMRRTDLPLLVVPPEGPEVISIEPERGAFCHIGQVLIPVDFGPGMASQIAFARLFLSIPGFHGTLLHVTRQAGDTTREADLEDIRWQVKPGGAVSTLLAHGSPREVIRELLQGHEYGLVVMGRDRQRAGALASELLLDSNALVAVAP